MVQIIIHLLPERAVKLDDYLDVELLLLAIYRAYWDHFNTFKNWEQRDAFCIRGIGLIQSVQAPKTAEILCESLDSVVAAIKKGEKKEISAEARGHKLKGGEAFYRSSRCSSDGLGFDFLCGIFGWGVAAGARRSFGILMSNKNIMLGELITQRRPKPKTSACVIF